MSTLLNDVRQEVVDFHDFFTAWFNGTTDRDELDVELVARFSTDMTFITPEGVTLTADQLIIGFQESYGTNADFKIEIRDVAIRHVMEKHILVTYTEWQRGATMPSPAQNARQSSALLTKSEPFKWLHVQETWLNA